MKKIFRITNIVILALAFAMTLTVAGNSLTIAAGTTSPSCSFIGSPLQNLLGQFYCLPPGPTPNVGWNS